jgi:hypothetical protein
MPNPENIIGKGFDKRPENINRTGQNRKTISSVNLELENLGYTEATKQDITSCYLRLIQIPIPELESKVKDGTQPALVRIVGKAILSGKGFDVIEKILDRGIGKATGTIEVTGKDGKDLIPPKIEFVNFDNE